MNQIVTPRPVLYGPNGKPLPASTPPPSLLTGEADASAPTPKPTGDTRRTYYVFDDAKQPEYPSVVEDALVTWPGLVFKFCVGVRRVARAFDPRMRTWTVKGERWMPIGRWMIGEKHRKGYTPRGILHDGVDFFFVVAGPRPKLAYRPIDRRIIGDHRFNPYGWWYWHRRSIMGRNNFKTSGCDYC